MASTTSLVPATEPIEPTVIKTDKVGRMRRTPQQRERILDEFERSGLSGGKFADLCGVKYQTFATWVQGSKHQRNAYRNGKPRRNAPTQVKWLEASVQPEATCTQGLRLQLPGGVQVEISHAGALRNPSLQMGASMTVRRVGQAFSRTYSITATKHTNDITHGYRTEFAGSASTLSNP